MKKKAEFVPKLWVLQYLDCGDWVIFESPYYHKEDAIRVMKDNRKFAKDNDLDEKFRVAVYDLKEVLND